MNNPSNLLVLEAGGGCELLDSEELYEVVPTLEKHLSEEILIIKGTITVSP